MKSHVSMEQHRCTVCGVAYDTGAVLLHRFLRPVLNDRTVTGVGLCDTHRNMRAEGYIALIEANEAKERLGRIAHIRREAWSTMFDQSMPPHGVAFVTSETMDLMEEHSASSPQQGSS